MSVFFAIHIFHPLISLQSSLDNFWFSFSSSALPDLFIFMSPYVHLFAFCSNTDTLPIALMQPSLLTVIVFYIFPPSLIFQTHVSTLFTKVFHKDTSNFPTLCYSMFLFQCYPSLLNYLKLSK